MPYQLPPLPYRIDALEPYIDALTMEIHHDRHQQAYVNKLNKALEGHPDLQDQPLQQLLKNINTVPEGVRTAIRNNGGGTYNHSLFWLMMSPKGGGTPKGTLADALKKQFGSFEAFQEQFNTAAKTRFGSGWAWLSLNKKGDLQVTSTANQDCPLSDGHTPIIALDVWEHAYYLQYQNRRPDYISAWWHVVNWEFIEATYRDLVG